MCLFERIIASDINNFLYAVVLYVQAVGFTLKNYVFIDGFKPVDAFYHMIDFFG